MVQVPDMIWWRGVDEGVQVPDMIWWRGAVGVVQDGTLGRIYKSAPTVIVIIWMNGLFGELYT